MTIMIILISSLLWRALHCNFRSGIGDISLTVQPHTSPPRHSLGSQNIISHWPIASAKCNIKRFPQSEAFLGGNKGRYWLRGFPRYIEPLLNFFMPEQPFTPQIQGFNLTAFPKHLFLCLYLNWIPNVFFHTFYKVAKKLTKAIWTMFFFQIQHNLKLNI